MSDSVFRLPYSSYDQITKIVMAYGTFPQTASNAEVGRVIDVHATTISANGAFLMEIGVLEGGGAKGLTQIGRDLSRALQHEMPSEIRRTWREIVRGNDFLEKVLSSVRIRKGMERSALQAHIAYSAGQSKNENVMRGASAVIDILRASELLQEDNGKLVAVTEQAQRTPDSLDVREPIAGDGSIQGDLRGGTVAWSLPNLGGLQTPVVSIQIQIQCTAAEIEFLGPKLRRLLQEISDSESQQESLVEDVVSADAGTPES